MRRVVLDLGAQVGNMHHHGVVIAVIELTVDALIQLCLGKDTFGRLHHLRDDLEFRTRQLYRDAVLAKGESLLIQFQLTDHDLACVFLHPDFGVLPAPDGGFDVRDHFQWIEWFGQIGIRADIQPQDAILIQISCRQDDHRDLAEGTQLFDEFKPIHDRHHNIHQRRRNIFFLRDGERVLAVLCRKDLKPFPAEI